MKLYSTLFFIFLSYAFSAQGLSTKGAKTINTSADKAKGTTRAVVFGISDYQDDGISDLNFADKDAHAFIDYLKSEAGGTLSEDQFQIYTNETATTAKIALALDWLMEESLDGDVAIIYFSGHSDVETKFKAQNGYLLTHDSPSKVYTAGAFSLGILNQYIGAISESNVQVIMISDACHAGKLAGSANGGSKAASVMLQEQFNNEIKILSCQPDEFSLEGPQWGGGRGVFSFYLLKGLYGMADTNKDLQINLLELGRYLEDNVSEEAMPHNQLPMTVGNRRGILVHLDDNIQKEIGEPQKDISSIENSDHLDLEEETLKGSSLVIKAQYAAFKESLLLGNLMTPPGSSAKDYFEILSKIESIQPLHDLMRRSLAAALQDEVQQVKNKILE